MALFGVHLVVFWYLLYVEFVIAVQRIRFIAETRCRNQRQK